MTWTPATTPPPVEDHGDFLPRSAPVLCSCAQLVRTDQPPRRFYSLARYTPASDEDDEARWTTATADGFDITDYVVAWQHPEDHPPIATTPARRRAKAS